MDAKKTKSTHSSAYRSPNGPVYVQTSLLTAGMRIRKAMAEGYKTKTASNMNTTTPVLTQQQTGNVNSPFLTQNPMMQQQQQQQQQPFMTQKSKKRTLDDYFSAAC